MMDQDKSDKNCCKLSILDFRLWVHLGCSEEEKFHAQMVSFNIHLFFEAPPKGVDTDNIQDTVCYFSLVESITAFCQNKRFNLIENLTGSIYQLLSEFFLPPYKFINAIQIETHKISPPVQNVHGGVRFSYQIPLKNKPEPQ